MVSGKQAGGAFHDHQLRFCLFLLPSMKTHQSVPLRQLHLGPGHVRQLLADSHDVTSSQEPRKLDSRAARDDLEGRPEARWFSDLTSWQ